MGIFPKAWEKCVVLGLTLDLLSENLQFNQISSNRHYLHFRSAGQDAQQNPLQLTWMYREQSGVELLDSEPSPATYTWCNL